MLSLSSCLALSPDISLCWRRFYRWWRPPVRHYEEWPYERNVRPLLYRVSPSIKSRQSGLQCRQPGTNISTAL
ncbi:hypothetical protein SeKA_B0041 (plasmid) [Salmonella enterica subsp. enterica serovar Kentucky str. CVM29188]|nr:hypothetical protein SeKA_B0017 [Salmonella enterica subsp. enterica serovar Kentucky str. CVM29188]ACF57229.1 hypothetical protein SeKA_B0041 [Salmonella enterica subsp. enterica serovar Kentucky str. CVM29188]